MEYENGYGEHGYHTYINACPGYVQDMYLPNVIFQDNETLIVFGDKCVRSDKC